MPIIQGIKRISPLNLNKNVTIGVAFPLDETNLFSGTQTIQEQIKSNLIDVLLTAPGERVNLPTFGVGIKNLLFAQAVDLVQLKETIQSQSDQYIGNIKIIDITSGLSNDMHIISLNIIYQLLLDGTEENIQLNFN